MRKMFFNYLILFYTNNIRLYYYTKNNYLKNNFLFNKRTVYLDIFVLLFFFYKDPRYSKKKCIKYVIMHKICSSA